MGEIASSLDVGERTLRRWSEILEDNGYEFQKRDRSRVYSDRELSIFTQMKSLTKGVTATEASSYVVKHLKETDTNSLLECVQSFDEHMSKFEQDFFWEGKRSFNALKTRWEEFKESLGIQSIPDSNKRGR